MNQEMREEETVSKAPAKRQARQIWTEFWDKDTDTVLYTLMCILTIPTILCGAGYLWLVQNKEMPACAMVVLFGLYCPGCGGTRAVMSLLRGEILRAVCYHPAAVYGVALYVIYFVSQTLMRISKGKIRGMKLRPLYLYIMLAFIMLNFVIRNVLLLCFHIDTLSF